MNRRGRAVSMAIGLTVAMTMACVASVRALAVVNKTGGPQTQESLQPGEDVQTASKRPHPKGRLDKTDPTRSESPERKPSPRAKGQLILTLNDTVTEPADLIHARGGRFRNATTDRSDSLDRLNAEVKVRAIRPLLRSPAFRPRAESLGTGALAKRRQAFASRLDKIRTRHRVPAQRTQPDASRLDLAHTYVFDVSKDTDIEQACRSYVSDAHVKSCQPNYARKAALIPNDPYYDRLWALKADRLSMESAWDLSQGQGVVVAVIDTGVDYTHPDLAANVWTNPLEIAGNGVDDDGNGYIDDIRGWDVTTCAAYDWSTWECAQPQAPNNDPMDVYGHGTHVSGTIAAVGNNGVGVIGVAPQAKIMPVQGLNNDGVGWSDWLAEAIVYAAMNGAKVLNNSWGCWSRCPSDPVIEEAVRVAHGLGAVVVFAAGNSNDDVAYYSPQNMPETIAVAATDSLDRRSAFSNYGTLIDVAAPGEDILSTIPGNFYESWAGTSMAAPHVSGLSALIRAYRPTYTNEDVRQALHTTADDVGSPGFDVETGFGRINAARALGARVADVRIELASPITDSYFTTQEAAIPVTGTAAGGDFQQYQLFYRQGTSPQPWIALGAPVLTPVENGLLGTWTIGGLITDRYELRLLVTSVNDEQLERVARIFIEAEPFRQIATAWNWQRYPEISRGRIVWDDLRNRYPNYDIYLFDLATNTERQLTTDPGKQQSPAIWGDLVVWEDWRNDSNGACYSSDTDPDCNADIYLYDLATGQERQITTDPSYQVWPRVSGDRIVWYDLRNEPKARCNPNYPHYETCNADIYLYDLATGRERQITTDPTTQWLPDISGDLVVWEDWRNDSNGSCYSSETDPDCNADIYLYDLATGQERQITTDPSYQGDPKISGERIVWDDFRNDADQSCCGECNQDIYLYDLATDQERQITTDPGAQWVPDISGDRIVWADPRYTNLGFDDIVVYDLSTNTEHPLTMHPDAQEFPAISGHRVVWEDWRNIGADIFLYEFPNRAPLLELIGSQTIPAGQLLSLRLSARDPDGEFLTYTAGPLPAGAMFDSRTGYLSWIPDAAQIGDYVVIFSASDGDLSTSQTVAITVSPVNQAPLAHEQAVTTPEETPVSLTLSGVDPDGEALTYTLVSWPTHGSLEGTAPSLAYLPAADYAGADALTFTVSDGQLTSAPATVSITISPVNDAPTANAGADQTITLPTNTVTLEGTAADVDSANLTVTWSQVSGSGTVTFANAYALDTTATFSADGSYVLRLTADDGQLVVFDEVTITVVGDTAAPTTTVLNPPDGLTTTNRRVPFRAQVGDNQRLRLAVLRLDREVVLIQPLDGTQAEVAFTPAQDLAYRHHVYQLGVTDASGNTTIVKRKFRVQRPRRAQLEQ